MYIPNYFKNNNIKEVKEFINRNGFGTLINIIDGKPRATHIPLEWDTNREGKDILLGHISKANPQWKNFNNDESVLTVFLGPHSYISSSWYNHENVPTWNYIAVHIYGRIRIIEGGELLKSLNKLVDKYERNSAEPVSIENLSPQTLKKLREIVGFEIIIREIQAAYKLSQNRNKIDFKNIIKELENTSKTDSIELAAVMKEKTNNR